MPPRDNRPSKKRKPKNYVLGRRCEYCMGPIIGVFRHRGGWIPIEPRSWDGSAWFIPRQHIYHGRRCEKWRERKRNILVDPDTDI